MSRKRSTLLAWGLCVITILGILVGAAVNLRTARASDAASSIANGVTYSLFLITSAIIGTLIISRHPRNTIGWLLMFFPLTTGWLSPLDLILPGISSSTALTVPVLLMHWIYEWSWWLLIGPILLIPLLYPSGELLSRRWRWVIVSLAACFGSFLIIVAIEPTLQFGDVELRNPMGLIPVGLFNLLVIVFQVFLIVNVVFCVLAIFLRYRRAPVDEREQIKWLLYAFGVFLVVYIITFLVASFENVLWGIIFNLALIGIPLAIGAAILRYHLWDIDLIINRTLVYVPLTAILAGLYSATVALSQKVLTVTTGQKSDVVVILTTFLIVATFTPVKNGLQQIVDRRFKESSSGLKEIDALDTQVRSVMEVLDVNLLTRRLLSTSVSAFRAAGGAIYLERGGEMRVLHATPQWRELDQKVSFPLAYNEKTLGLLSLGPRKNGVDYTPAERKALQQAADRVAWAIIGPALAVDDG